MERALERDKNKMLECETDLGQETQTSRAAKKSPIHELITQSNKESVSGKTTERPVEKVESSTSMGDNHVSNLSKNTATQSVNEITRAKLRVHAKSSGSDDSPDSEKNETSSTDSQSDHANEETSKADKRTLRKGKWAVGSQTPPDKVAHVRLSHIVLFALGGRGRVHIKSNTTF